MVNFVRFSGTCFVNENDKKTVKNEIKKALNENFYPEMNYFYPDVEVDTRLIKIKIKDFEYVEE